MRETPQARSARLAQIRQQIAAGTYETSARLEAAVDALARQLEASSKTATGPTTPPRRAK